MEVCNVISFDSSLDENKLLELVASAELKSEHPLGKAIVSYAKNKGLKLIETDEFTMTAGKGIQAKLDNQSITCGNESYMSEHNILITNEIKKHLKNFAFKVRLQF